MYISALANMSKKHGIKHIQEANTHSEKGYLCITLCGEWIKMIDYSTDDIAKIATRDVEQMTCIKCLKDVKQKKWAKILQTKTRSGLYPSGWKSLTL